MKAYTESTTDPMDKDEQATPRAIVDRMQDVMGVRFAWDVCATADNTVVPDRYYDKEMDALSIAWTPPIRALHGIEVLWMNPPYSALPAWTEKAMQEGLNGLIVVGCVPHMPSSRWFQKYVHNKAATIYMPDGRISFELDGKTRSGNPLPTCFPVWTPWQAQSSYQYFSRKLKLITP